MKPLPSLVPPSMRRAAKDAGVIGSGAGTPASGMGSPASFEVSGAKLTIRDKTQEIFSQLVNIGVSLQQEKRQVSLQHLMI